jgi:hypothetical protein
MNIDVLADATFVFISMDDAEAKRVIVTYCLEHQIPFIDVGMGVEQIDGQLTGLLRTTVGAVGDDPARLKTRIPQPTQEHEDDYSHNIQVADLNALNGTLAIGRWKRMIGLYADGTGELFSTYSVFTNDIINEDSQ